ncbi:MAG TPA: hypothetical protein VJ842_16720 [Pyrinomonadaceae bacterium]|nr:hypothetical protein [Pyrinomonadaceae bacterium]
MRDWRKSGFSLAEKLSWSGAGNIFRFAFECQYLTTPAGDVKTRALWPMLESSIDGGA